MQNYVQTISNLLKEEHRDKWDEAQLVGDKGVHTQVIHSRCEQAGEKESIFMTFSRWDYVQENN